MELDDNLAHQEVTQGKYALSIPTSLAIETLFGLNDNVPPTNPLPYTKYDFLAINVLTLVRNLYGSVEKSLKQEWGAQKYLSYIQKEIENIPLIIDNQSQGKMEIFFYLPSYRSLKRYFPNAVLKGTGKRAYGKQHYEAIEQFITAQLTARILREGSDQVGVYLTDTELPTPKDRRILIMSHQPVDLIPYTETPNTVGLLESHTGLIKGKYEWYTKFGSKGEGIEHIPFRRWSIQWFGDGKLFTAYPVKYRRTILDFSIENKWNQTTTDRLISTQIKRLKDSEIRQELIAVIR